MLRKSTRIGVVGLENPSDSEAIFSNSWGDIRRAVQATNYPLSRHDVHNSSQGRLIRLPRHVVEALIEFNRGELATYDPITTPSGKNEPAMQRLTTYDGRGQKGVAYACTTRGKLSSEIATGKVMRMAAKILDPTRRFLAEKTAEEADSLHMRGIDPTLMPGWAEPYTPNEAKLHRWRMAGRVVGAMAAFVVGIGPLHVGYEAYEAKSHYSILEGAQDLYATYAVFGYWLEDHVPLQSEQDSFARRR